MAQARKRRRRARGAVPVIAGLLIASAVLRLWTGSGPAVAEALSQAAAAKPAMAENTPVQLPQQSAPAESRAEMSALLAALQAREERLRQREEKVEVRARALAVADTEIARRLALLEETEERLRQTLALADGAAEDDLARLTSVYENMKPKDAAALFEAMEPDFAAGFLGRMRPDAAAAVMAGLSPEVAYSISAILAGRNAGAPKS